MARRTNDSDEPMTVPTGGPSHEWDSVLYNACGSGTRSWMAEIDRVEANRKWQENVNDVISNAMYNEYSIFILY